MKYYGIVRTDLYLEHHGVLGMKWGVRRYQNKDGTRTALGKKHQQEMMLNNRATSNVTGHPELGGIYKPAAISLATELAIAAGGTAAMLSTRSLAGASSAAAGAVALGHRVVRVGESFAQSAKVEKEKKAITDYDKKTGLPLKPIETSAAQDLSMVNPLHGRSLRNGVHTNCMMCTTAYDLRRRGYAVTAGYTPNGNGFPASKVKEWYPKSSIQTHIVSGRPGSINKFQTVLALKSGEGSRGNLMFTMAGGAHSVGYEVKGGKVEIIDGQINRRTSMTSYFAPMMRDNYYSSSIIINSARLDNVDPDVKAMKKDGVIRT